MAKNRSSFGTSVFSDLNSRYAANNSSEQKSVNNGANEKITAAQTDPIKIEEPAKPAAQPENKVTRKKKENRKKQAYIYIPMEYYDMLDEAAKKDRRSLSDYLSNLIMDYIDANGLK